MVDFTRFPEKLGVKVTLTVNRYRYLEEDSEHTNAAYDCTRIRSSLLIEFPLVTSYSKK